MEKKEKVKAYDILMKNGRPWKMHGCLRLYVNAKDILEALGFTYVLGKRRRVTSFMFEGDEMDLNYGQDLFDAANALKLHYCTVSVNTAWNADRIYTYRMGELTEMIYRPITIRESANLYDKTMALAENIVMRTYDGEHYYQVYPNALSH